MLRCAGAAAVLLLACACSVVPPKPPAIEDAHVDGWHAVNLPGKRASRYLIGEKEGRWAIAAAADSSASMLRRRVDVPAAQIGGVRFSWWVDRLIEQADVTDAAREDAVARVIFAFDGDRTRLSMRNQALFDLAQALTGEAPPFATLMYVWETKAPAERVIVNPRTDRIRKIVVDSGSAQLRRWREHERDLVADYQRAFGELPGRLIGIAVMTDGDNTASRAAAWYGRIELKLAELPPPSAPAPAPR
jgi:hypothetical protein